jgi:hypothetical protein
MFSKTHLRVNYWLMIDTSAMAASIVKTVELKSLGARGDFTCEDLNNVPFYVKFWG